MTPNLPTLSLQFLGFACTACFGCMRVGVLKLISDTRQKMNLRLKTKEDPTTA